VAQASSGSSFLFNRGLCRGARGNGQPVVYAVGYRGTPGRSRSLGVTLPGGNDFACGVDSEGTYNVESGIGNGTGARGRRARVPIRGTYLASVVTSDLGAGVSCFTGSGVPLMASLKPRIPSPRPLPSSGSLRGPKIKSATTRTTIRCVGVRSSPMEFLRLNLLSHSR